MMTIRVVIRGLAAFAVFALVLASCSDKGLLSTDTQLVRLMLVPAPTEIEDGESRQVAVVGVQVGGRQVTLSPSQYSIQWASSDPSVLQIEGTGNFVTIRAVSAGRANISVDVTPLVGTGTSGAMHLNSDVVAAQVPTDFTLASQNDLTGLVGAPLPDSVSVRVIDRSGTGVRNVEVNFQVLEGGGTVSKTSSTTDSLGYARTSWRLGSPGTNTLQARSDKPRKNVNVNAHGQNAQPAAISVEGGNSQTGVVGSSLPNRLSVRVVDGSARPIPGLAVSWSVLSGGGSITPQSAPTDDQGISTVYWTLGTVVGTQAARASVTGLTANFSATGQAGAAARLVKLAGDAQSAAVSARLTDSLSVQVVDQYGNPVSGTTVGWTVQTGGGTISPVSTTSGANGMTKASWTMGATAGGATARAAIAGVDDETFSATAVAVGTPPPPPPPPANTIVKLSGDAQSGAVATRLTDSIAVRVQNAQGIGVAGIAVTWTVTSGNGTVSPASGTTNSNGVLRTAWTMGPAVGPATLKATAANAGEVNFAATATASTGGSTQLTTIKMSGDAQTGTVSMRLTDSLVVQVKDAQGVAMSGVNVSWAVVSGNGSVSPSSFTTNASGFARTAWTLGSSAGAGSVSASATNAIPVTFTSTANPPAVTQVAINPAVDTINALNGQVTLVATARDANNQVVPNTRFTWTSLSSATATVDSMGIVTARAAGRALIIATAVCCSRADTAAVDVILASGVAPGQPGSPVIATSNINVDTFLVTARWGRASNAATYEWSSGASTGGWNRTGTVPDTVALIRVPRVATDYYLCVTAINSAGTRSVDNACGAYVAPATGGGTPAPVATVAVAPTNPSIGIAGTVQLSTTLRDATNNILTGRTVTWQSSNSLVTVSALGLALGVAPGSATITATSEGRTGTTVVTVTSTPPPPPTVTAINVSPVSVTLNTGQTQQFSATASMSDGSTQNNPSVTWTATGGTITTAGLYTAGSTTGSNFRVIATGSGKADTANVTIQTPPPPPPPGTNNMFFNSAEQGCGSDANILLCDDFEDGEWYAKNCDLANASGGLLQTDGWCGTIYNAAGLVAGTVRCGGVGFNSPCAATTGVMSGGTTGNMADHALANGQGVNEIWVRFYTKPLSGYQFGAEKMLTFNDGAPGGGGIKWGNLSWNCAAGSATSTGTITMGFPVPQDECARQNLGNALTIQSGNWYFYEAHFKLSTPGQADGVFELWLDNCGPTGTACPATPTLRMRRTDILNGRTSTSQLIRVVWFEAWSNPTSRGERYWDQIKVSKAGPIGFMR